MITIILLYVFKTVITQEKGIEPNHYHYLFVWRPAARRRAARRPGTGPWRKRRARATRRGRVGAATRPGASRWCATRRRAGAGTATAAGRGSRAGRDGGTGTGTGGARTVRRPRAGGPVRTAPGPSRPRCWPPSRPRTRRKAAGAPLPVRAPRPTSLPAGAGAAAAAATVDGVPRGNGRARDHRPRPS